MNTNYDRLTQTVTAFRSYSDLLTSCRDGYVPTLSALPGVPHNDRREELAKALEADGCKVWRGL